MGGSNWDEMLGVMTIAIAIGGVWGIDGGDCGSSIPSATVAVLLLRLCFLPDTRDIRRTPLINPRWPSFSFSFSFSLLPPPLSRVMSSVLA
jgi:hypothetical protein